MRMMLEFGLPLLALTTAVTPASGQYGFTISASSTDPYVNHGPAPVGDLDLHLWYVCHEGTGPQDGLAVAEFAFAVPAGATVESFTTSDGFLNAGSATEPILAVADCPDGPLLAGTWHVSSAGAGSYCLVPNSLGLMYGVYCGLLPGGLPVYQRGYAAGVIAADCPQIEGFPCGTVPVRPTSWGGVKSLYR